jgi:hypothetical protein
MATVLAATNLTLADWAKRYDDEGISTIIELLSQTNEIIPDMILTEANGPTSHRTTMRTSIPSATWRMMNQGVAPTKSTTAQITDTIGMLETYSYIDKALADLNGDTAEFRLSEDLSFIEGMNQQIALAAFYANPGVNPQQPLGLSTRYWSVATANGVQMANVIDGGGTQSANTSVWITTWGANTYTGLFPKGQRAGLNWQDKGDLVPALDSNSNPYEAYRTHFKWDVGFSLRDWRYVCRIANIDINNLIAGTGLDLIKALVRGVRRLPTTPARVTNVQETDAPNGGQVNMGRLAIYMNRTAATYIDIQALYKTNVLLKMQEWDGEPVMTFRGIPVRVVDQLINTEARLT